MAFPDTLKQNLGTFVITTLIAVLTIFSNKITESIKYAINRADQQAKDYDQLAIDLSTYVSSAEFVTEFYDQNLTTKSSLEFVIKPYNEAIINLRKREYVNIALLERVWGTARMRDFADIMLTVRNIDSLIHQLNPQAEIIANSKDPNLKADPAITRPIIDKIKPLFKELDSKVKTFLINLR